MAFALKTNVPVESVLPQVRREVAAIDRDLPVHSVVAAADLIAEQTSSTRLSMWLMTLFGLLALSLAVVGVYGMLSYVVNRRTQEFGLRLALGATRANVLGLVFRQTLLLLVPGLVLGLAGGAALARLARDMFYGVSPSDPTTFAAVSVVLTLVGLVASYVPARRAVRVDPISALRSD
jgi:putative ABC transport system permease protein